MSFSNAMPAQTALLGQHISAGVFAADVRYHAWNIARNSIKVSNFVRKYGEEAASLIADVLSGSAPDSDSLIHAHSVVAAVGRESAALLPPFIRAYYYQSNVDHRA